MLTEDVCASIALDKTAHPHYHYLIELKCPQMQNILSTVSNTWGVAQSYLSFHILDFYAHLRSLPTFLLRKMFLMGKMFKAM